MNIFVLERYIIYKTTVKPVGYKQKNRARFTLIRLDRNSPLVFGLSPFLVPHVWGG